MRYVKRPVEVEAIEWTGENFEEIKEFCKPRLAFINSGPYNTDLIIETLEGDHHAQIGDFIIKGIKGECYPCKPDIFAATYEAVTGLE